MNKNDLKIGDRVVITTDAYNSSNKFSLGTRCKIIDLLLYWDSQFVEVITDNGFKGDLHFGEFKLETE